MVVLYIKKRKEGDSYNMEKDWKNEKKGKNEID